MKKILAIAFLIPFAMPLSAADAAPAAPAAPAAKPDAPAKNNDARQQQRMQRMIDENPELKGVDPTTPEGEAKIRDVMQKRFATDVAPKIRQRMAEAQAASHAKLQESLKMAKEEFAAIEPLLTRVEQLRQQKGLVDATNTMRGMGFGGGRGGRGGPGGQGGGGFDPTLLLGDTPLEPSVQECQAARKALKGVIDDAQSNTTEVAAATARLRKGVAAFQAALDKAEGELKGVLTPRQEAQLVENGILD